MYQKQGFCSYKIVLTKKKYVHFYLGSRHLLEEEIHGTSIDRNDKYFTVSRTFCLTKIRFIMYHRLFCGKLKEKLFSRLLTIFRKTYIVGSGFTKFLKSAAIVKIDVLPGVIFHNRQANNYMTCPVWISLNILRTCSLSRIVFYHCIDLNLVITCLICRCTLRPSQTSTMKRFRDDSQQLKDINFFRKSSPS